MSLGQLLTTLLLVLAAGLGFFYWWGHYYTPDIVVSPTPITDQYDITAQDSGKTFKYKETSRFTVYLDATKYDVGALACTPSGVVGSISNAPVVAAPLIAKRFEVVSGGTCKLKTGGFAVVIIGETDYGL